MVPDTDSIEKIADLCRSLEPSLALDLIHELERVQGGAMHPRIRLYKAVCAWLLGDFAELHTITAGITKRERRHLSNYERFLFGAMFSVTLLQHDEHEKCRSLLLEVEGFIDEVPSDDRLNLRLYYHFFRARSDFLCDELESSVRHYQMALKQDRGFSKEDSIEPILKLELARSLAHMDKTDASFKLVEQVDIAGLSQRDMLDYYYLTQRLLLELARYQESLDQYGELQPRLGEVEDGNTSAHIHLMAGEAEYHLGRYSSAIVHFEAALSGSIDRHSRWIASRSWDFLRSAQKRKKS